MYVIWRLKAGWSVRGQHQSFLLQFISNDFIILLMPPSPPPSPILPQRLGTERHSAFKWNTDCFSCLFTTHGSAASHNLLFLPRTIWGISWIKMILIISQWKDPWQLWIPLEPDQRPLVSHLYGQSNSIACMTDSGGWLFTLFSHWFVHTSHFQYCTSMVFLDPNGHCYLYFCINLTSPVYLRLMIW